MASMYPFHPFPILFSQLTFSSSLLPFFLSSHLFYPFLSLSTSLPLSFSPTRTLAFSKAGSVQIMYLCTHYPPPLSFPPLGFLLQTWPPELQVIQAPTGFLTHSSHLTYPSLEPPMCHGSEQVCVALFAFTKTLSLHWMDGCAHQNKNTKSFFFFFICAWVS